MILRHGGVLLIRRFFIPIPQNAQQDIALENELERDKKKPYTVFRKYVSSRQTNASFLFL